MVSEISTARDQPDDGHDHVLDQRFDDGVERQTQDEGNGKFDHVATFDKLPEFFQHRLGVFSDFENGRPDGFTGLQAAVGFCHLGKGETPPDDRFDIAGLHHAKEIPCYPV